MVNVRFYCQPLRIKEHRLLSRLIILNWYSTDIQGEIHHLRGRDTNFSADTGLKCRIQCSHRARCTGERKQFHLFNDCIDNSVQCIVHCWLYIYGKNGDKLWETDPEGYILVQQIIAYGYKCRNTAYSMQTIQHFILNMTVGWEELSCGARVVLWLRRMLYNRNSMRTVRFWPGCMSFPSLSHPMSPAYIYTVTI